MSAKLILLVVVIVQKTNTVYSFWLFTCPRGNHNGIPGDECSFFCQCRTPFTCEAFRQHCVPLSKHNEVCHLTKPCATDLSCQPGIQRCFNTPRRLREPCSLGFLCAPGLSCAPAFQVCFNHPRLAGQPCSTGYPCKSGLSCHPGEQRCYHAPRLENEPCFLGFECSKGLSCSLCGRLLTTCQMSQVPVLSKQDFHKPYNQVAFLVAHNSYSYGIKFGAWAHNQRVSVTKQLNDGVRGLMLDIYPGWGVADVRLCHSSCYWSGSSNLLDTLIEIRKFLDRSHSEVVTIIFEDYVRNPSVLAKVFDAADISRYVLRSEYWGEGDNDWPTLAEMASLGRRLVVFNSVGMVGFPYSRLNMWNYVTESHYGSKGKNANECEERSESENGGVRALVLINWFTTIADPLTPCLNDVSRIKDKLNTCRKKFGKWTNFLAIDYYDKGRNGGAFKAVQWLNHKLSAEAKSREVQSYINLLEGKLKDLYNDEKDQNGNKTLESELVASLV